MSWLSETLFGKKPSLQRETITDPVKGPVASQLSSYLQANVGKGIPRYEGELAQLIDPNLTNRYNEFLNLNANDMFDRDVAGPQTEAFKRDFLPVLQEGYAGSLRGSGRFRSEEDATNKFSQDLAGLRYTANKELPVAQMTMAQSYYAMQDTKVQREYENWWKSLPENNPILEKAMQFLGIANPSGTNILTWLNPGSKGFIGDMLDTGMAYLGNKNAGMAQQAAPITASTGGNTSADWWGGSA